MCFSLLYSRHWFYSVFFFRFVQPLEHGTHSVLIMAVVHECVWMSWICCFGIYFLFTVAPSSSSLSQRTFPVFRHTFTRFNSFSSHFLSLILAFVWFYTFNRIAKICDLILRLGSFHFVIVIKVACWLNVKCETQKAQRDEEERARIVLISHKNSIRNP